MPDYEYKCKSCGIFEVHQKITDEPLKYCPTCNSLIERIISKTSFILNGHGWYKDGYSSKKTDKK